MEKLLLNFSNNIRCIKLGHENTDPSKAEAMKEVYEELLSKCEKYSKTITKLKAYMSKITKEYDKNVELLLQKLEKQKSDTVMKETVQKFNKKILTYKLKIRDLQESVTQLKDEWDRLESENKKLKKDHSESNLFKSKISRLKSEYESKINQIIDEVKGKYSLHLFDA